MFAPLYTLTVCWLHVDVLALSVAAEQAAQSEELVSVQRQLAELSARRDVRETESCAREDELQQLEERLETLTAQEAAAGLRDVTLCQELQQMEDRHSSAVAKESKKLAELEQEHGWLRNHRRPDVRRAVNAAQYGPGGHAIDNRSAAVATTSSSSGGGNKKRKTQQQYSAPRARVTHSVQTLGGHAKPVQVQLVHTHTHAHTHTGTAAKALCDSFVR